MQAAKPPLSQYRITSNQKQEFLEYLPHGKDPETANCMSASYKESENNLSRHWSSPELHERSLHWKV
jgi:hypothetical protein